MRRQDIEKALAEQLGLKHPRDEDETLAPIWGACESPEERLAAKTFLRWVTQCHHLNQAAIVDAAVNFPTYNLDHDFLMDSLVRTTDDLPPGPEEGFRCEVNFPPLEHLALADPGELIAIRQDLAPPYFLVLNKWIQAPNPDAEEAARKEFSEYCRRITQRYAVNLKTQLVARFAKSVKMEDTKTGLLASTAASAAGLGALVAVVRGTMAMYSMTSKDSVQKQLQPEVQTFDVNLPESG